VQLREQEQDHRVEPLKVHKLVWDTDHLHEGPHLLAQLTARPGVIAAVKRLLIHQDSEVAPEFSEKGLEERVFLDAFDVLSAAN
jgi:hypothetical protein